MKILKQFIIQGDLSEKELQEIYWCCQQYQRFLDGSCLHSCPATKSDYPINKGEELCLCTCCAWGRIGVQSIPEELKPYGHLHSTTLTSTAKQYPDFNVFFMKLKNRFEALCEKGNLALKKYSSSLFSKDKCRKCCLNRVCNYS